MAGLQLSLQSLSVAPEALVLLLAALVLDAVAPARLRNWGRLNPNSWLIAATGFLEKRLNRADRSPGKRLFRGAVVVVILVAGAWAAGWGLASLAALAPFGWVVMLAVMAGLTGLRKPVDQARGVAKALTNGGIPGAQALAAGFLGPRAANLDAAALARNAIAYIGERLADGLAGAVFWFVLLGLPGMLAYRAVRIAGKLLPEQSPRFEAFGMAATRLSGAAVLLPSMVAGVLVAAAAVFSPGTVPSRALAVMAADWRKHAPSALGWPVAALVGALGLAVGAVGAGGRRHAGPTDIARGAYLYGITGLLAFGLVATLALIRFMT